MKENKQRCCVHHQAETNTFYNENLKNWILSFKLLKTTNEVWSHVHNNYTFVQF